MTEKYKTTLEGCVEREAELSKLRSKEPDGSLYAQDLDQSLKFVRDQIKQLTFARNNPMVMVNK